MVSLFRHRPCCCLVPLPERNQTQDRLPALWVGSVRRACLWAEGQVRDQALQSDRARPVPLWAGDQRQAGLLALACLVCP